MWLSCRLLCLVFSLYLPCCHRALRSFPTRRSSDLAFRRDADRGPQAAADRRSRPGVLRGEGLSATRAGARSEEHTSELQSRGHIVCRLPLETKKIVTAVIRGAMLQHDNVIRNGYML